jgi:hypothetical protein
MKWQETRENSIGILILNLGGQNLMKFWFDMGGGQILSCEILMLILGLMHIAQRGMIECGHSQDLPDAYPKKKKERERSEG